MNSLKKVLFLSLFFSVLYINPSFAQVFCCDDYIPNGSFEANDSIPPGVGTWRLVDNWTNAAVNTAASSLYGSPDYFHLNPGGSSSSLPNNSFSTNVFPVEGEAVMGFSPFINLATNIPREYLGVQFNCPLVVGIEYELSFFITQGTPLNQSFSCDNISVFFSVDEVLQSANVAIIDEDPQFTIPGIISNEDWVEVVYNFTAEEPFEFMIIGNFASQAATNFTQINTTGIIWPYAYYFVDDFELKELIEAPELAVDLGPDRLLCNGVTAGINSGVPNASYEWSTGDTTQNISVNEAGLYSVTVTSDCLVASDSIMIQTGEDATFEFSESICQGESFVLNDESFQTAGTYVQELSGMASSGCDSIIILELFVEEASEFIQQINICQGDFFAWNSNTYSEAGIFTQVLEDAAANGCDSIDMLELEVIEGDIITSDVKLILNSEIQLLPEIIGIEEITQIEWSPSTGLSCSDCLDPIASPQQDITYTINISDSFGCTYSADINVDVFESLDIYIPNAFSPNDDGFNDLFAPQATPDLVNEVKQFQIFDRWGGLIWEANNFNFGDNSQAWNGKKQDDPLLPGVYVYTLEVILFDGTIYQLSGDVLLIR